jgi:flagellar basal body P-ring formation protein FlgA
MIRFFASLGVTSMLRRTCAVAIALVIAMPAAAPQTLDSLELTVPTVAIHAGTVISEAALGVRTVPRAALLNPSVYASRGVAIGKIARRTLVPGQPIPIDALRAPHVIVGGQSVRIVYQSGALRVSGDGIAQHGAGLGEMLTVRRAPTGALVRGRVTSPRDVQVEDEP